MSNWLGTYLYNPSLYLLIVVKQWGGIIDFEFVMFWFTEGQYNGNDRFVYPPSYTAYPV